MNDSQKIGGIAALIHAAAYVFGIVLAVTLIFPVMNADPSKYIAFVADNQGIVYIWNLAAYWVSAVTLIVMALALYERLKAGSQGLAQTATVFALIWAGLIIGSGNLMLKDISVIAELYGHSPEQAQTTWLALEAVENGIVSGNELVGSLWVLLLSIAASRSGALTRAVNYMGMAFSLAGILTIIPAIGETMIMIFAPGMIVWSVWVGILLLRTGSSTIARVKNPITAQP